MTKAAPSRTEFIALVAMMTATVAFSIDAMLPALPALAEALTPEAPNRAQLVVTSFVLGMGIGTFFTGPLSDRFGRKPVVVAGALLYMLGALLAMLASSLEALLAARLLQGLGASGPRVVALAIVRDLYMGRGMAQILSYVMIVFSTVPAVAPLIGAGLLALAGWEALFAAFILFSAVSTLWLVLRLPETLAPEARRPFRPAALWDALKEMLGHPVVRLSIAVQSLNFGTLFAMISMIQPVYDASFGRAESFPLWFGAVAVVAASASFLNAALVMRLGMRRLVAGTFAVQLGLSAAMLAASLTGLGGDALFAVFVIWQFSVFFQAGMTMGNLNAIAMEPMGHIAGMAASVTGSIATVMAVILAAPLGLLFDGTPVPLSAGILVYSLIAVALMRLMSRAEARLLV